MRNLLIVTITLLTMIAACISCIGINTYRIFPSKETVALRSIVGLYGRRVVDHIRLDSRKNILPGIGVFTGTAFAVDKDHLLTAGHICRTAEQRHNIGEYRDSLLLRTADKYGLQTRSVFATIARYEDDPDLCLLISIDHGIPPLRIATSRYTLRAGDRLLLIGAPIGRFPIIRDVRVAALRIDSFMITSEDLIAMEGTIQGGHSGSPVIANGHVVGLVTSISRHIVDVFYMVPPEQIRSFLQAK